jgi:hypothetical protein
MTAFCYLKYDRLKGICKLCDQEKDLLNKSHIIPEFMYQYLFDEKHQFMMTSSSEFTKDKSKSQYRPSGEYEGGILCHSCDNDILGAYESYASRVIYSTKGVPDNLAVKVTNYQNKDGQSWSLCENVDYQKFKLFLLSLLWRASISTRHLFSEIELGPHENRIKRMIFTGDPGEEAEYPVQVWTTVNNKDFPKDFVLQPRAFELDRHKVCIFPISGLFILFFLSVHEMKSSILDQTVKKTNSLKLTHIPSRRAWAFFVKYLSIKKT